MLLVKCFEHHLNGKKIIKKRVVDISLELQFHHKKNYACMAQEKRNCQKTAVLKTVLIIFLRNDCKMDNLPPCVHFAVSFTAWFL